MKEWGVRTGIATVAALAAILVVYLTPLKWLNIIPPAMNEISPAALQQELVAHPEKYLFLDVRSQEVYATSHAKGSRSQPIGTLYDLRDSLPRSGKTIVLICTSGRLAAVAYGFLRSQGYLNLLHVQGGIQGWVAAGLPLEGKNTLAPLPERD
jgi:rhodanese-related sulfurtransferase